MKKFALVLSLLFISFGESSAQSMAEVSTLPSPSPSVVMASTVAPAATPVASPNPPVASPTPAPVPTPVASPSPVEKVAEPTPAKCRFSGGFRLVSRYHGGNGEIFRDAFDQNLWGEGECNLNKRWSAYIGGWVAFQFQEIDANVGIRYNTDKLSADAQYQILYLLNGKILVHNLNLEVSTPLVKNDKVSIRPFARIEGYITQKQDNLPSGAYLIGGVYTNTKLGEDWNLSLTPKFLYDLNGAFGSKKGGVFITNAEVTKQFGDITTGPGIKLSAGNGRPKLATFYWTFYF